MRDFKSTNGRSTGSLLAILLALSGGCASGSGSDTGTAGSSGTAGAAGTTGGGGGGATGTGGAGSGAPSVCDGTGTRILALDQAKVDNFEGAGISPGWSTFNDVMPTSNAIKMTQEAPGALGTGHYAHYAGTGAKTPVNGGFGVGAIYNMAIDMTAGIYCVDISAFAGVTFWAKAATTGSKVGVNFVVPATNATGGGGDCRSGCYLHPQKTVTLTTEWAQYSVAFSAASGGTAKVTNRLQELGWLSPDSDWDFSLDEIQLYQGTPPTGPVPTGN